MKNEVPFHFPSAVWVFLYIKKNLPGLEVVIAAAAPFFERFKGRPDKAVGKWASFSVEMIGGKRGWTYSSIQY